MGLPINSYKLFEAIANKDDRFLNHHLNVDFKLFAILLHDPYSNPEFDKEVGRSFYNWHLESGREFLFTALADPPKSWIDWASKNNNQFFRNNWPLNELVNPNKIHKTFDPSLTALFISEYLGIPFPKLPAIIFTPDLNLPYFYWMSTGISTINAQMKWLSEHPIEFSWPEIDGLKFPLRIRKAILKKKFSQTLVDLSQKISDLNSNNTFFDQNASIKKEKKEHLESEVELDLFYAGMMKVGEKISLSRRYKFPKDSSFAEEENLDYCIDFQPISNGEILEKLAFENLSYLEKESRLFIQQGFQLVSSLNNLNVYDFSPYILPFAKSFEKELSYSIVHWVRKNYDISLPRYFYEFQPGKIAKVLLGKNYEIDFNQSHNDIWISPTLGGQISGFKKAVNSFGNHPFKSDLEYQEFLNVAYQIKNVRNRACHSESTTKEDLDKILSCWKILFEGKYLETLSRLKVMYRGVNRDLY
jgi:hypothetical protein